MIVAAHQPSYLPWLGYLHKMVNADVFVIMDDLQYTEQNFQNRNRIKVNNGPAWLTVPLARSGQQTRICEKQIRNDAVGDVESWHRKMIKTLEIHYSKSEHYNDFSVQLYAILEQTWDRLSDLNNAILECAMKWFEISTPVVHASTMNLNGCRTERIVNMCKAMGATTYLSGSGASARYLDRTLFERAGIELAWQHFDHPVYTQRYPQLGFLPNLAFVDYLFNCGADSARNLFVREHAVTH
jgi:hypothetical protein